MNPPTQSSAASRLGFLGLSLLAVLLSGCAILPRAATHASPAIVADSEVPKDWPVIAPFDNPVSVPFPPPYQQIHDEVHAWAKAELREGEQVAWGWSPPVFISPSARYFVADHPRDNRNRYPDTIGHDPTNLSLVRRRMWVVDGQNVTSFTPPFAAWQVAPSGSNDRYVVTQSEQDWTRNGVHTDVKVFEILPDRADELTLEPPFVGRSRIFISPAGLCVSFGESELHFGKVEGKTIRIKMTVPLTKFGPKKGTAHIFRNSESPVWSNAGTTALLGGKDLVSLETAQIITTIPNELELRQTFEASSLFIGRMRGNAEDLPPADTLFIGAVNDDGTLRVVRSVGKWPEFPDIYFPSPHADRVFMRQYYWGVTLFAGANRVWGFIDVDDLPFKWYGNDAQRTETPVRGWIPRAKSSEP